MKKCIALLICTVVSLSRMLNVCAASTDGASGNLITTIDEAEEQELIQSVVPQLEKDWSTVTLTDQATSVSIDWNTVDFSGAEKMYLASGSLLASGVADSKDLLEQFAEYESSCIWLLHTVVEGNTVEAWLARDEQQGWMVTNVSGFANQEVDYEKQVSDALKSMNMNPTEYEYVLVAGLEYIMSPVVLVLGEQQAEYVIAVDSRDARLFANDSGLNKNPDTAPESAAVYSFSTIQEVYKDMKAEGKQNVAMDFTVLQPKHNYMLLCGGIVVVLLAMVIVVIVYKKKRNYD